MDKVHEELDEAKAEIEKLRIDLRSKAELYENLKKAYNDQVIKNREASSKNEMQTQELNDRAEEITMVKQTCEDFQRSLNDKESILRRVSSACDKLSLDCDKKCRKWEEERRGLVLALDEANEKNIDQEQKIHVLMAENEGLKGLLSAAQKKCLEAEKKTKAPKELRERDDLLFKLEEENRKVEDQLKWKKEQFTHLEEAHANLRDQFGERKGEWEQEKATLVEELCSLQTSLDSQTRISEDFQNQLKKCNQALAHEESRRKYLEVEVSEFKMRFEAVFTDFQEARSQIEVLTVKKDEEITSLRHALGKKETLCKEFKYQAGKLEQENQELLASIKELQEAQIQKVRNPSPAKLLNKLKFLEQMQRDCSVDLRAKEAEWSTQLKKLNGVLYDYKSALESKDTAMKELEMELANCHCETVQLRMQNEESSIMLLLLESGITEAHLKLRNMETEMNLANKEREINISQLMEQLELKNTALDKAQTELDEACQKAASLLKRIECLDFVEEQQLLVQKELERYKAMLEELSRCQLNFKVQALQTENDLTGKLKAACDALEIANAELTEEREKVASLSRKAESFTLIEEKHQLMQKEIKRYKEMLEESSKCKLQLEDQALQVKNESKVKFREACHALDKMKSELSEQCERAASLSRRVESLDLVKEQLLQTQKELEEYKRMVEESSRKQLLLEEKSLCMETELKRKLREACDALDSAKSELAEEQKRAACLSRRVESFGLLDKQQLQMQKEFQTCKEMFGESSKGQVLLEKEALQKENHSRQEIQEVREALDAMNSELAAKICEGHAVEFELWIWKSIAERLKDNLEENQALRKELEASLLAQIEVGETIKKEKDDLAHMLEVMNSRIDELQQQVVLFEQELKTRELDACASTRMETMTSLEFEKVGFLQMIKDKEKILEGLQREIAWLEQESLSREIDGVMFTQIGTEKKFELEKGNLIQHMEDQDQRIDHLLQLADTLVQKFNSSLVSFAEKQAEIIIVHQAWEKIAAAEMLALLEIEEKKLMIVELKEDICSIQKKLESEEKVSSFQKQQALQIEAKLEGRLVEMKNLLDAMETKLKTSEALVHELKNEKGNLIEDIAKLSSEREQLLGLIMGADDRISQFSSEDTQLLGALERILSLKGDTELFDSLKEKMTAATVKHHSIVDDRSPFRELN